MYSNLVSTQIATKKLLPHQFLMTNWFKWTYILISSHELTNEMRIYIFSYPFYIFSRILLNDKKWWPETYIIFPFYLILLLIFCFFSPCLNKWHLCHAETHDRYFGSFVPLLSFSVFCHSALILYIYLVHDILMTILRPQYFLTWYSCLHFYWHHSTSTSIIARPPPSPSGSGLKQ